MLKVGFNSMSCQLEICCYNVASCLIASAAGAHRIELCANPADGGTTAGFGLIKKVKEKTTIPVYPIIRPRGGDFLYSNDEFEIMQSEVLLCKELSCEGVVIGMLMHDGTIDKKRCAALVQLAYPMEVTFHRAFDRAANPFEALEDIINIGCTRILSSGQRPTAMEGASLLNELIRQANERIIITPGSGIRSNNIAAIAQQTGAVEFHSAASTKMQSEMNFINDSMNEQLEDIVVNRQEVVDMINGLNRFFES
jgi:copper homeostasis protein